ncbi:hypothetical protein RQP46_008450 [Phenoliferia psychrophenolica]
MLQSPQLEAELAEGTAGPYINAVKQQLVDIIALGQAWKTKSHGRKVTREEDARGRFVLAWAMGRCGEFDGTTPEELPGRITASLDCFAEAAALLDLPAPPPLDAVPSVTRPSEKTLPLVLGEQPSWVTEYLAEYARTQTTLAFSMLLLHDQVIEEAKLADLLDLACRRNVQALFTPVDPLTASDSPPNPSEAGTVLGNSRLIRDMSTMFPFSSSVALWTRRVNWATHVADVRFVEASMSANRLVDAASASASILQSATTSDARRNEVRGVLEATIRRLVPFEKAQGSCLLGLGRVMLEAVGALYLGRGELASRRRRDASRDSAAESDDGPIVPENELVRETRQVLIRAAGLFENAYASFRRTPPGPNTSREEQRILLRLEAAYCDLEELDNDTPEVVELRSQRVDRALWINERLVALHDELGNDSESGDEEVDSDEEDADLSRSMARHGI